MNNQALQISKACAPKRKIREIRKNEHETVGPLKFFFEQKRTIMKLSVLKSEKRFKITVKDFSRISLVSLMKFILII